MVTSHSKTSSDQKLQNGAEAALYLFENAAVYDKPLVNDFTYKAMTPSQKAQNCTLDYNTYIVEGQITEETTIESARKNFRVWAVTGWENKREGSDQARHIKVLLK